MSRTLSQTTTGSPADLDTAWSELTYLTREVELDDERFWPMRREMRICEAAYKAGDWRGFEQAANAV